MNTISAKNKVWAIVLPCPSVDTRPCRGLADGSKLYFDEN